MVLLDLLGRRWTLRVIWELRDSALTFRELQTRCGGLSPTVLNSRLAELRLALLVETSTDGYQLSALGRELLHQLLPLHDWAEAWSSSMQNVAAATAKASAPSTPPSKRR